MGNNVFKLVLFSIFSTCSSTQLWRIETSPPSYIFGTIHIPYKLVWPYVSNETRQAFLSSTHFYAEIDAKNEAFWDDFLQCLRNRLSRTQRLTRSTTKGELLDVYLSTEARRLNKTVGNLESAEYHCQKEGWRYNLTTWLMILNRVKKEMKNPIFQKHYFEHSINRKYLCDELSSQYIQRLMTAGNLIQDTEQRDEQMSKYIHTLLHYSNHNHRYFFAVGAGHMLGKHQNLIVQLKKFGYNITRICIKWNRMKKKNGCKKKKIMKHCIKKEVF